MLILSTLSRDDTLDEGWTEVEISKEAKDRYQSLAAIVTVVEAIRDLYWTGVERDIAAAILSFADIEDYHPEALANLPQSEETNNLTGLINLLDPYVRGDGKRRPADEVSSMENKVKAKVSANLRFQTIQQQRARSLLQACGFMDLDSVREYRSPTFRSWGQRPQVEKRTLLPTFTSMLVAVQCSQCRNCIRSFHYYQCKKGCIDSPVQRNRFKMQPHAEPLDEMDHWWRMAELEKASPLKICPACLPTSTHPRSHLRAVRQFSKAGDTVIHEFARELDAWEDYVKGRSLLAFGNIALERISDYNSKMVGYLPGSRTLFPAGNSHSALMFGPLLIENGMTKHPGGAFLSIRSAPTLSTCLPQDIDEFLAEPFQFKIPDREEEQEDKLFRKVYSVSSERKLFKSEKPVRQRRFLSTMKQVSGGLFSGHCAIFTKDEDFIIDQFITVARVWSLRRSHSEPQSHNRNLLRDCARVITSLIREAFVFEIDKYLFSFAERLQKRVKLQYSRTSNNCQDFCKSMIFNFDKFDQIFKGVYASLPPSEPQGQEETCLRYLMSFAGSVSQHVPQGGQATLLATSVSLYDWFPLNDADLIDHVSSIRFKDDPERFGLGNSMGEDRCHDEYLLKDSEMTCVTNLAQGKRCTLPNHLLDCPFDNLSVLTMHIHRARELYTIHTDYSYSKPEQEFGYEEFLSLAGPKAWVKNRLNVLHRLLVLNTYLASISQIFQDLCVTMPSKELRQTWKPPQSFFSRARHDSTRVGNDLIWSDQNLVGTPGNLEGNTGILGIALLATLPFMQAPEIFNSRWKAIKKAAKAELKGEAKVSDTPWENCGCNSCLYAVAVQNCRRARAHAETRRKAGLGFSKFHPDYTPTPTLQCSVDMLGEEHSETIALAEELKNTPGYFNPE